MLDDRGIMCKLLVLADEHAEFVVIQSDIFLYHIFRQSSPISYIIINEIEHHIRIIHGGFSVRSLCEAIVVVPWLHQFYQFIHGVVVEIEGIGIVSEHFAHFFLREARHLVKLVCQGVVGADIETAGQIIHSNRTNTRYEYSLQGGIGCRLDSIEEFTEISRSMGFCLIAVEAIRLCQNGIGEMIVLVNEEIHLLSGLLAFLAEIVQLLCCTILLVHLFFQVGWQILCIHIAEVVKLCVAMRIKSLLVILKIGIYHGKVERDNQIGIMLRCRIFTDIQSSKQFLKPVSHIDVIILLEHGES